jgi:hypothetical protein
LQQDYLKGKAWKIAEVSGQTVETAVVKGA